MTYEVHQLWKTAKNLHLYKRVGYILLAEPLLRGGLGPPHPVNQEVLDHFTSCSHALYYHVK